MKKIYIYALASLALWGAASCKKPNDFGSTNVDPKAVNIPIPAALFANAINSFGPYVTTNTYSIGPGAYAQYFSETQYPGTSLYNLPQVDFTGVYNGPLYDLQNVINLNQSKNSVAAAKILQSYYFWILTDSFGDLPYSQALQGIKSINPVYDKQEDIYKGLLNTLTAAIASMDGGSVPGDLCYGGDAASWKRMANSLKLLISLQASKAADNDFAKAAFVQATSDAAGLITDNSQNFKLSLPGGTSNYNSPWYNLYNGRTDWAESKTMTDMTASLNDGRTVPFGGSFTDPNQVKGGTITSNVGVPNGYDRAKTIAFTSANPGWALVLRADYRTQASSIVALSAAEVLLALTEGANIGWIPNTAMLSNYQKGIQLSFEQWGVADPAASYYTNANVVISIGGANNAKNIATQQWIAAYPDGHYGWDIWRKTGFPVLSPAPEATNSSKQIVRRFVYNTNEYTTNEANVRAAVAREKGPNAGTDSQDNTVWWDPGR
ncbi:SusD/RagB family nutrient-binding outer membrane lipoprotein [Mucilaginibacter sp. OK098]|uniref:SusD/RagB family nutrient-binding outer membrane lipoprotein n=1 Tax=Mucilaginibacter sp. OK098 TaxID=1855297 RepID=UPI00091F49A9|nr:SusD/RagB family nutrient-binding outer membrane lipoprotein [Mucilaginibacter sp. OK098]SHM81501.1 Starch-binding associating with outer membrane [Mucilaginibacter sp. OK098]